MNTKVVTEIINWLITSGWLAGFLAFTWKLVKPLIDEKRKHAKTVQQKELMDLIEQLADTAVTSLVGDVGVSGSDKFQQATKIVGNSLAEKGLSAPKQTIDAAVQSAYEKSDLTPTSTEEQNTEPITGTVINCQSAEDPVLKAVEQAPNRANDVEEG